MNLAKAAAVLIGVIVVFLVLGFVVHVVTAILGTVLFLAVLAGGGYVAYKVVGSSSRRRRELRRRY